MRLLISTLTLFFLLACVLPAQQWEVGAAAGYGFWKKADVTSGSISGQTGFEGGFAVGAVIGNNTNNWLGGEARYTFRKDDMMVKSGSTKATAGAQSHAIHYDVLIHATPLTAKVRPFIAMGAGVKLYRGTGNEPSFQPLSNLVALTKTNETQPLISVGAGAKFRIAKKAIFRLDARDYLTPVPSNLLGTPGSVKVKGWMHDFVFLLGISSVF